MDIISGPMMVPEVIRSFEQSDSSGPMAPGIRSLEQSESSFLKVDGDEVVSEGNTSNIPLGSPIKTSLLFYFGEGGIYIVYVSELFMFFFSKKINILRF